MPRKEKPISHLARLLKELRKPPLLTLKNLKCLQLTYAFRNDHFGARHFVKESLPRIRYANPGLDVRVNKPLKTKEDIWCPEMILQFENGESKTLPLHQKWSSTILRELMDVAGTSSWETWKQEQLMSGKPVVEDEMDVVTKSPLPPSWEEWKRQDDFRRAKTAEEERQNAKTSTGEARESTAKTMEVIPNERLKGPDANSALSR